MEKLSGLVCLFAVIQTISGDCNVTKCINVLPSRPDEDVESVCPKFEYALKCLEIVIHTCDTISKNDTNIEQFMNDTRAEINLACEGILNNMIVRTSWLCLVVASVRFILERIL